ncbi:MAG: hypothetical protein U9Q82_03260 [Chloroflexota bacterium]|nr:hypothetical protein [Chloroflexota bacterium]
MPPTASTLNKIIIRPNTDILDIFNRYEVEKHFTDGTVQRSTCDDMSAAQLQATRAGLYYAGYHGWGVLEYKARYNSYSSNRTEEFEPHPPQDQNQPVHF